MRFIAIFNPVLVVIALGWRELRGVTIKVRRMRIILRDGKVNISPKMQALHARNLPLSRKMAINLQSFGSED